MPTQNLKGKKNNNLKDQKRTRLSKDSAIIKPFSSKQTGKWSEEALKEFEERFRLAFENANIGMSLVDLQGRLIKVNHQMCEIFGYSQEELEGMTVNDIAHPEDLNISPSFIQRATSGEIEYAHFEKRYFHKDGHIVYGQVSSSLVRNPQGVPQYFISHVQDITERKKTEEALKEGERFLFDIFSSIQDGISILDNNMNIIRVNQAMEKWYSHAMPLIGKKCYEAYHGRSERCEICPTYQTINTGKAAYEVVPKTGPGKKIVGWLDLYSFPIIDTVTEKMRGVIEYVRDISERKQAEEALRRSEENTKRWAQENATMAEIGRIINSTLDIEEVYERFAEEAHKLIPFDGIAINIINHMDGIVTVPYVSGIGVPGCQPGDILPLEGSVTGEVARTRSGLIIQTEDKNELQARFPTLLTGFDTGLRSVIAVPLISEDQAIGAIHFRSTKSNAYSNQDLKLAEGISSQITGAIANAQLFIERKQAERALRSERDKFRGMLLAINDGVDIVNKDYFIEFQNELLRERFGDKIGEKCYAAYMGLGEPCHFCSIQQAIKTGTPTRVELVGKDGKNYELNSSPFRDVDREVKVIELVRDISERKRAEEALRQSEERYRTILESIQDGYFEVDLTGNCTFANDARCRSLGYIKEELIGMNNRRFTDKENAKKVYQAFNRVYRTGEPVKRLDEEVIRKDGTKAFSEISISLIRDSEGKPIGFRGISRDITERKRAEEKYRTIILTTMDGFWIVNMQGRFLDVNDAYCQMIGYSRDELLTMSISDVEAVERSEETVRRIQKIMEVGGDQFETRHKCKDGRIIDIEVSVNYMEAGGGLMFVFLRDITERKQKEEEIRHTLSLLNATLESTADGILVVDREGKIVGFNQKFVQMWHIPQPIIESRDDDQALAFVLDQLKDAKGFLDKVKELYSQPATESFDFLEFKDGRVFDRYSKPQWIGKQSVGRVWSFRDVTGRKKAEEALRTEKQRFQTLSEQAPFGMVMIDQEGTFKYMNPQFRELFGYDLSDVPDGRTWFRKAYPDPTYRHHAIAQWMKDLESFERGERIPKIFTATCKDGTKKTVNFISVRLETGEYLMTCEDITERKQAEENLKESEEKYRLVVEGSIQGIVIAQGFPPRLVFSNPAMTMILGYTFEELSSLSPKEIESLVHSEDRAFFFKNYKDRLEGKSVLPRYEIRGIRKDGTVIWLELSSTRIEYKGQPAIQAAFLDITERKQAEEALRQSEERYRTILENIEDGYYEVDLPGNFTFFNDSLCRVLGYSRDEMVGMGNQQYTDEKNRKKLFQAFNEVYRTGEPAKGFDWEVIRKDGTTLFGEVSVSLMKDSKGKPIGFRGIARDITERKQAEEALRNEKQRFQTLSDQAPFGMVMIDQDGTFKYINPKFRELFGYDLTDISDGKTWFRKAYPDPTYRHDVIEVWKNDLEGSKPGEKRSRIFTVTCKDGTKKTINFILVQLETSENLMACEDITERKRAEEEMRALEEQFRQSQKMEAVGRLGGGIAHDFNNLLTIIKGYSQLSLLDLKESDPLWGNIQEIQKATQRATDLTRQLLAFSRRQILDLKVLDMNTLLKDLDKMLRRIIGEDIELVTLLAEDLGRVKIDPGQFEQMILNLAVNARDAMLSGGKLTIETTNVELDKEYAHEHIAVIPGHYIRLTISDTGIGMSREVREKVFEPFFTTKEKGKGTGLGLSTVYGIVKQSGGNIWVYSEPGYGTTFKIYLPRVEEELGTLHGRDETDSLPRGSETVLLVEDEPSVRNLAHRLLNQQGYKVLEATNGEEALRVFHGHMGVKIHLLLTDVVMPQMGGKELADQLKILQPDVKVLYTSGYTDNAIVHHGVLDPGTHFLQKPFSPKTLSHKVREVLDG